MKKIQKSRFDRGAGVARVRANQSKHRSKWRRKGEMIRKACKQSMSKGCACVRSCIQLVTSWGGRTCKEKKRRNVRLGFPTISILVHGKWYWCTREGKRLWARMREQGESSLARHKIDRVAKTVPFGCYQDRLIRSKRNPNRGHM